MNRPSHLRSLALAALLLPPLMLHASAAPPDALIGARTQALAGEWQIRMDPTGGGMRKGWFSETFSGDPAVLPGTVETNPRIPAAAAEPAPGSDSLFGFTPVFGYSGAVWYQREVEIPEAWRGKHVELFLERCQWETLIWVDEEFQGTRNSLVAPHVYDLSKTLVPGRHRLTVMVDNSNSKTGTQIGPDNLIKYFDLTTEVKKEAKLNCGGHHLWSHNWNGILGRIELRAQDAVRFSAVDAFPDLAGGSVRLRIEVHNRDGVKGPAKIAATCAPRGEQDAAATSRGKWTVELNGSAEQTIELALKLAGPLRLWDEFQPALYQADVRLESPGGADTRELTFGMRELGSRGTQFLLNGRPVFMRATLEDFIFPLTGHPPLDVASWRKLIAVAKSHGLNMLRFHSCCPPEAAFVAADELGFYLQVEVPGTSCPSADEAKEVEDFLSAELARILAHYGNHPSLLFVSMGNEQLVGGPNDFRLRHEEVLRKKVQFGRERDPRHFYTCSTQPFRREIQPPVDDFYVSAWAPVDYAPLCGIQWGGGQVIDCSRFNTGPPDTAFDYGPLLKGLDRPLMTHEVGQWAVYPDLREITRYHGAQRATNFMEIRHRLESKGMLEQAADFTRASGMLALELYKEEIESALRTPNLGGFQLLDLHDYPGQGTSTVGILNALWESKGLITPAGFRAFCGPTVALARLPKRVWTQDETLTARIDFANYGPADARGEVTWTLAGDDGAIHAQGSLGTATAAQGSLTTLGTVTTPLAMIRTPASLVLRVEMAGVTANSWKLWVYPNEVPSDIPAGVMVASQWDSSVREALHGGGTVLWLPSKQELHDPIPGTFTPVFWNVQMKNTQVSKTMGLLINPADPALAGFPTAFHSDWQWWDPVMRSSAMRLDGLPQALRPAVAVIDSFTENRRLAMVFEAKFGAGRLLVCSIDLEQDLDRRPVARQLRRSLLDYMAGPMFQPDVVLGDKEINSLIRR